MKTKHLMSSMMLAAAVACALSPVRAEDKPDAGAKSEAGAKSAANAAEVTPASEADGVRSITLPAIAFDLPEAPGKNLVVANCIICHSPSYITMQPAFPRKVWEAEVTKMRTTFGAPIPEQLVPQIVDYLVKIRGTEADAKPAK